MLLNQQTRLFYDEDEARLHSVNSEKPMRYHMQKSPSQYFNYPHNIETDSKLRSQPTRLNEIEYPSIALFGTAPLQARNAGPVDVESSLLHGDVGYYDTCVKPLVEEYEYFKNHIILPGHISNSNMVEDKQRVGESTRNTYKNKNVLNMIK